MSNRSRHLSSLPARATHLLAAVAFFFVLLGMQSPAWASRVVAPMCTPDAQSMPAPLQRTPTSDAKIQRVPDCPSVDNPGWDIVPQVPDVPTNWNLPASDPIWLAGDVPLVPPVVGLDSFTPYSVARAGCAGYPSGVFHPPRALTAR